MKKIENKKVTKKSLSHYCRAALLSLFVMLTIPSISSGVFGSGDAEAGCNPASTNASAAHTLTQSNINDPAFCGGDASQGIGNECDSMPAISLAGQPICTTYGSNNNAQCLLADNDKIVYCSSLNQAQCDVVGTGSCIWRNVDTETNSLVDAVCRVYLIATGTAGKAFAAVGVISVGIGFFTGKVSWGLMISVAAGIAVFFGAPSIISVISGSDASNLCTTVSR